MSQPIHASLHAVPPASLRFLEGIPGVEYEDDTLTFVTEDLRAAYEGLVDIVGLARLGYFGLLQDAVMEHPDGEAILADFGERLRQRWFDQESGRYERPEAGQGIGDAIQRFHGYR